MVIRLFEAIGHCIAHLFGFQGGEVVSWYGCDGAVIVGLRCRHCWKLYGVHASFVGEEIK